MCSHQEWERLARRFQAAIDEDGVREFVADALTRVEALVEELNGWACSSENPDGASRCGRRSRPDWVA
jgi:hypothetical protein